MYIRSLKECQWNKYNKPEWQEFERLVRDCAAVELGQEFHLFGRMGQNQHGIDIFSHNWKILIQCKAYKEDTNIETEAKKDYQTAISYFTENGKPFFDRYIIATTLKTDGDAQIKLRNTGIEVWFWDDICRIIDNYKFHNDSDKFVEGFEESLFLHRGNNDVCLKNLFVPQEYKEINKNYEYGFTRDDLEDRIKRFIQDDKYRLMIIEGDAGSGKSSLVGWLNYIAKTESDKKTLYTDATNIRQWRGGNLFSGRPLITIRLRDLRKKLKKNECELGDAILEYMRIDEKRVFKERFPNAVFVLDGFDELCMINGIKDYEDMITRFCGWAQGCKIIITSRPKYIKSEQIADLHIIALQHFSKKKRDKWLEKYISLFPQDGGVVEDKVADYIRNVDTDSASAICDTPLLMYMLVGSKVTFELTRNTWMLYNRIFSRIVIETKYSEQMKPEDSVAHNIGSKSKLIYQITEEIAFKMHCIDEKGRNSGITKTEDGKFLITEKGVKAIIENLRNTDKEFEQATTELGVSVADLQRSYALCCYWKTSTCKGPAEFYHNNIRDFFICEKIYRAINAVYSDEELTKSDKITTLATLFIDIFRHGILSETVCDFILWRASYAINNNNQYEFPVMEKKLHFLPTLYEKMMLTGTLYNKLNVTNLIQTIEHILHGTAQVYRNAYEPILKDMEHIKWWNNVEKINASGMIGYIFSRFIGEIGSRSDFENVDLQGAVLRNADLSETNLSNADLSEADMSGADLRDSDLSNAFLNNANLSDADLSGAILCGADLFGAILSDAILKDVDLQNINLDGVDFSNADLRGKDLSCIDLSGINMSGADLSGADLSGADLSGVNLRNAILRNANMRDVDLRVESYRFAIMHNLKIQKNYINGELLQNADMLGAHLEGAALPDGFHSDNQSEQIAHLKSLNIEGLKI